jgi:transcriptional regulator with XRE-family HTH domain
MASGLGPSFVAKTLYRVENLVLAGLLRQLREDAGLVQTALGERLGRNQTYVSNVELAIRRLDLVELRDYCVALKITLPALVDLWEAQIPRAAKSRRAPGKRKP